MSSLSAALGASAAPLSFTWGDREITLKPIQLGPVLSKMENWLIQRALDGKIIAWEAMIKLGRMTDAEMLERIEAFTKDCVENGSYSMGSAPMQEIFGSLMAVAKKEEGAPDVEMSPGAIQGLIQFLSIITDLPSEEVIRLMREQRAKTVANVQIVSKRSLPDDPKSEGETTAE